MCIDRRPAVARRSRPAWRAVVQGCVLIAALLGFGCASQTATTDPVITPQTLRETASTAPRPAPPASRDALAEGLRWILVDAPSTQIQSAEEP